MRSYQQHCVAKLADTLLGLLERNAADIKRQRRQIERLRDRVNRAAPTTTPRQLIAEKARRPGADGPRNLT
jgi:hypothetical protein